MALLKESDLRQAGSRYRSPMIENTKARAAVSIFLSHSHKDKDLVLGFINLLGANSSISVYVDWQDGTMPAVTNGETANRIKQHIDDNLLFMVLATNAALESRWVPWEIGVADVKKVRERIFLVPIADPQGHFRGNEYMQLYQRLEVGNLDQLFVVRPDQFGTTTLKSWLSSRFFYRP